ncbi:MAG: Phosphopantetheine attachment site [Pseudomonadota bacterium]|jgi:acyl carrier protein
MSEETNRGRLLAIEALHANPLAMFSDHHRARLSDPGFDVSFEELGLDSLGRMELSIWLELEHGIAVTEVEVQAMESLAGLAAFLAAHAAPI